MPFSFPIQHSTLNIQHSPNWRAACDMSVIRRRSRTEINMKKLNGFAVKAAGATSLALLLTTSAFADYRHQDQTDRGQSDQTYRRGSSDRGDRGRNESSRDVNRGGSYRENDRVTLQGRITSFDRENNGYR